MSSLIFVTRSDLRHGFISGKNDRRHCPRVFIPPSNTAYTQLTLDALSASTPTHIIRANPAIATIV